MPIPKSTPFTAYDFTAEEYFQATRFSELNLMLFKTLQAEAVEQKVGLKLDLQAAKSLESATISFMQQEAELNGMIQAYDRLVSLFASTTQQSNQQSS